MPPSGFDWVNNNNTTATAATASYSDTTTTATTTNSSKGIMNHNLSNHGTDHDDVIRSLGKVLSSVNLQDEDDSTNNNGRHHASAPGSGSGWTGLSNNSSGTAPAPSG